MVNDSQALSRDHQSFDTVEGVLVFSRPARPIPVTFFGREPGQDMGMLREFWEEFVEISNESQERPYFCGGGRGRPVEDLLELLTVSLNAASRDVVAEKVEFRSEELSLLG